MTKIPSMWSALLMLALPATISAQDPMAIAQGAQVYGAYCSSCHNARASSERTDLEWIPIVLHMRVRANFSKSQTSAVLAFLQATNLPETPTTMSAASTTDQPAMIVVPEWLPARLLARVAEPLANRKPKRGNR